MIYYLRKYSAFLFPLQMPRIAAGRFCLWGGGFADGPLYKSHLYRKTASGLHLFVQVSLIWPIINRFRKA